LYRYILESCIRLFLSMARTPEKYIVEEVVSFSGNGDGLQLGDEVELKQLFDWRELVGWEARNKYTCKSSNGKQLFIAEDSPTADCHRVCCGPGREWNLNVHNGADPNAPKVLQFHKPQECCIPFCGRDTTPCFGEKILTVETPNGEELASATEGCCPGCCCTGCKYDIAVEVRGEHRFNITGTHCQLGMCCPCFADTEFEITEADGEPTAGSVVRPQLTCAECCGKTNRIKVNFPDNADQADKAALLGGVMLFDILEEIREQHHDSNGGGGGGGN